MYDFYNRFIHKYPYTDLHELNLDWLINAVKDLAKEVSEFEALNTISLGGVWDISKSYATWTIVSDANGDGYISIQPVPSGIQLSNTDYWMKLYNFISALGTLEGRVTTLEGTVSNLSGRMTTAEGNISTLSTAVNTTLPNKIKAVTDWSKRNVVFLGDSYLDGINNVTYSDQINSNLHFNGYYKVSLGGSGFSTACANHYLTRLQTWIGSQSAAVKNSIDDIFVMGGYNDKGGTENDIINGAYGIKATVSYIKSNLPNARIWLGFLGRALYSPYMTFTQMNMACTAYRKGAINAGVKYLEGSELCLHDYTLFGPDGIHPTVTGYQVLGDYLTGLMQNGDFDYIYDYVPIRINVDTSATVFPSMPSTFYQTITRQGVTIDSYGGQVTLSTPIASWSASYAASDEILIGTYKTTANPNYFLPKNAVLIQLPITIQHSAGVSNVYGSVIFTTDGEVKLSINELESGTWNFKTFTNVSKILIGRGTITIPTDYC